MLVLVIGLSQLPAQAHAAAADWQKAQVSFTFDDGFMSTYQNAAPVLKAAGYSATLFYITGYGDGTFNNGLADDGTPAMKWAQVQDLYTNYGWEIGSHTVDHPLLSTLTAAQVDSELTQSNQALVSHGITPVSFAFPQGDYNNNTLVETAKYYQSSRGFQDVGLDTYPYNNIVVFDESLDSTMTLAQAEAFVDQAIANKQWLVFTGHGIQAATNKNYQYEWTTANFQALVNYIKSKKVPVVRYGDATKPAGVNLTVNPSFEQGLTGWSTDNSASVTVDNNNNGSYGTPANSVKLTGSTAADHLFSDLISVVPGKDYLVNAFYNTVNLTGGEFGFYLDEYDANGNWVSGQWLGNVANGTVGFFNKIVQATSALVSKFRIQEYLTAGSTGTVYTDNVHLQDLAASGTPSVTPTTAPSATPSISPTATPSGTPSVTPTVAPTGTPTNMVNNGDFDSGVTNGWTTDNANQVKANSNNNGTAPTVATSVGLTGTTTASHLFYSYVTVNPAVSYNYSAFANTKTLTSGELGYYIDEYDANGNWISGKWLGQVANGVTSTFSSVYKATSTLVSKIRIQTYLTANSVGTAYVDAIRLVNPSATPAPTTTPTVTPSTTPSTTPTPSTSSGPTATPTVTPAPTPAVTNLVQNPSFETVTSGWANNWTRDGNFFTIDTTSKGNNGTNSLHLSPNATAVHAFSALIALPSTTGTYHWTEYITTGAATGEFGFYIDEYDANGNWISGQWKGMLTTPFTGTKDITYTPTSASVKSVRLQYYVVANSTFNLFLDSVVFGK